MSLEYAVPGLLTALHAVPTWALEPVARDPVGICAPVHALVLTPRRRRPPMSGRHASPTRHAGIASIGTENVSYRRAGRTILDQVTLTAAAGEVLAVTGPSGSGKSTLLALLAGLDVPDDGRVLLDGVPHSTGTRDRFGLILQGYGLVGMLTAAENVEITLQVIKLSPAEVRIRTESVLDAVGLTAVGTHLIEELSGGQQQRVAIARALVIDPAVLLADELTAELDAATQQRALDLVFARADAGAVVVLATHDPYIAQLADHEIHLGDGIAHRVR